MSKIEFQDETGDPMDHQKGNLYCSACAEKVEDRVCDHCDGVVHIQIVEGSDIEIMKCDKCGWSINDQGKYFLGAE